MNVNKKEFHFENKSGEAIAGDIYYNNGTEEAPVVILLHGFKAFKDWGFLPHLAAKLAEAGNIVVSFSFSRCGVIDGDKMIYDENVFSANLVSIEISDTLEVYELIRSGELFSGTDLEFRWNSKIILIGFSRGAAISILAAGVINPQKLVLLAPISELKRYTARQIEIWQQNGKLEFKNQKTGQMLSIKYDYIYEILANEENYNLLKTIENIRIPLLILHGTEDLTVNLKESEALYLSSKSSRKELIKVEKTGHTFGVEHPFDGKSEIINMIISKLIEFVKEK